MKKLLVMSMVLVIVSMVIDVFAGPAGTAFTYQGNLTDNDDPAQGLYDFQFKLYDSPADGVKYGLTVNKEDVQVIQGNFTVKLDFVDDSDVFNGEARWLQIEIRPGDSSGDYTLLSPRQEMTPTSYALYAFNGPGSAGFWAASGNDIYKTNSGNVGIGTTTPVWELEVANLTPGDGAETGVTADDAAGAVAAYSSTLGDPFTHFAGRVSLFANFVTMGLDLRADSTTGDMRFFTGGPWSFNERVRITSDGGIRHTSYLDDFQGSWEQGIYFANNSNGMGPWSQAGIWTDGFSGFNGELVFGVDGDDTNNLDGIEEAMRIDKSGNLGVGTAEPQAKLHSVSTSMSEAGVYGENLSTGYGVFGKSAFAGVRGEGQRAIYARSDSMYGIYSDAPKNYFNGYVGIGTMSPQVGLHVFGEGGQGTAIFERSGKRLAFNPNYAGHNAYAHISTAAGSNMGLKLAVNEQALITMTTSGYVGIGTSTPQEALDVSGTIRSNVVEITGGSDLAEPFDVSGSESIRPGMVVAIDPDHPGTLRLANDAYDRTVAGCVSGANGVSPGLTMQQEGTAASGSLPVALSGRVYCWVDASYGPVQPGDLLTTSKTPGHAMKVTDYSRANGAILGKAMSSLDEGKGLVLILVSLQ